jgi:hypothetical protein
VAPPELVLAAHRVKEECQACNNTEQPAL